MISNFSSRLLLSAGLIDTLYTNRRPMCWPLPSDKTIQNLAADRYRIAALPCPGIRLEGGCGGMSDKWTRKTKKT
jgi:hypothetical protein